MATNGRPRACTNHSSNSTPRINTPKSACAVARRAPISTTWAGNSSRMAGHPTPIMPARFTPEKRVVAARAGEDEGCRSTHVGWDPGGITEAGHEDHEHPCLRRKCGEGWRLD